MYLTDPEENFWPWHWTHDGKALNTMDEHIKAFKTLDPYTDQTYNATMHLMCNDDGHKKNRAILVDNLGQRYCKLRFSYAFSFLFMVPALLHELFNVV